MTLEVRRYRFGYAVFDGGVKVSGELWDRYVAAQQLDRIAAKATAKLVKKRRPCMCCGQRFDSSGPFHRLCQTCHHSAGGLDRQMVG